MLTSEQVLARIQSFPHWLYQFDLNGHLTPADPARVKRHAWRKKYFLDPLVQLLGGSLAGKRVLDLGCNAGFWSLQALDAGCDYVLGIDAHPLNIVQASFVFDVKGVARERYRFERGNVFDVELNRFGEFDVVLCLGLLYHVTQPLALLEKIARVNRDILLIDTAVSTLPGRLLEMLPEFTAMPSTLLSADSNIVLWPTRQAVLDMARWMNYTAVTLKPNFVDDAGAGDYRRGQRRAFVCAKRTDLGRLAAETETVNPFSDLVRLNLAYARRAWASVKKRQRK